MTLAAHLDFFWLAQGAPSAVVPPPPVTGVVPLTRNGVTLTRPDGSIFKYRAVTGFRAPELYGVGERNWLDDYYGWVTSLGGNTIRVFSMWANTGYQPGGPSYYDHYFEFLEHAKARGLYVHVVAFCDQVEGSSVLLTRAQQDEHLARLLELAYATENVFFEIENESWKNGDNASAERFPSSIFSGQLAMRSDWEDGEDPSWGGWLSLATKHLGRSEEWVRYGKVLYEAQFEGLGEYDAAGIPALSGEPIRIAEGTTPRQHADHAACCELMGLGTCLHGGYSSFDGSHETDLQNCQAPTGGAGLDCANAYRDVWTSKTWDARLGSVDNLTRGTENNDGHCPTVHYDRYNSGSPNNHPHDGLCRSYYKLLDGLYYGLGLDPAPQWPGYETRDGWRILDQGGYTGVKGGNLLVLAR